MKKPLTALIALLAAFTLAACGGSSTPTRSSSTTIKPTTTPTSTQTKPNSSAHAGSQTSSQQNSSTPTNSSSETKTPSAPPPSKPKPPEVPAVPAQEKPSTTPPPPPVTEEPADQAQIGDQSEDPSQWTANKFNSVFTISEADKTTLYKAGSALSTQLFNKPSYPVSSDTTAESHASCANNSCFDLNTEINGQKLFGYQAIYFGDKTFSDVLVVSDFNAPVDEDSKRNLPIVIRNGDDRYTATSTTGPRLDSDGTAAKPHLVYLGQLGSSTTKSLRSQDHKVIFSNSDNAHPFHLAFIIDETAQATSPTAFNRGGIELYGNTQLTVSNDYLINPTANLRSPRLPTITLKNGATLHLTDVNIAGVNNESGNAHLHADNKLSLSELVTKQNSVTHLDLGAQYEVTHKLNLDGTLVLHPKTDVKYYAKSSVDNAKLSLVLIDGRLAHSAQTEGRQGEFEIGDHFKYYVEGLTDSANGNQYPQLKKTADGLILVDLYAFKRNGTTDTKVGQYFGEATPRASRSLGSTSLASADVTRLADTDAFLADLLVAADNQVDALTAGTDNTAVVIAQNSPTQLQLAAAIVDEGVVTGLSTPALSLASLKTAGSVYPDLQLATTKQQLSFASNLVSQAGRLLSDDKIHPFVAYDYSANSFTNPTTVVAGQATHNTISAGAYSLVRGHNLGLSIAKTTGAWSEKVGKDYSLEQLRTLNTEVNQVTAASAADKDAANLATAELTGYAGQVYIGKAFDQAAVGLTASVNQQYAQVTRNLLAGKQVAADFNSTTYTAGLHASWEPLRVHGVSLEVFGGLDYVGVVSKDFAETATTPANPANPANPNPANALLSDQATQALTLKADAQTSHSYALTAGLKSTAYFTLGNNHPASFKLGVLSQYHNWQPSLSLYTALGNSNADAALSAAERQNFDFTKANKSAAAFSAPWFIQADSEFKVGLTDWLELGLAAKYQWTQNWSSKNARVQFVFSY